MNKINVVNYIVSESYAELMHSVLQQEDVLAIATEVRNDIQLLDYIKEHMAQLSGTEGVIIDLSAVKDTDQQILSAMEMIRFFDDTIRIIIIASERYPGDNLLKDCFLAGIYNITCSNDYVQIRDFLYTALKQGMSYKDALEFKEKKERPSTNKTQTRYQNFVIALCGTQLRSGLTHNTFTLAVTLRKMGYMVAVIEEKESNDFQLILESCKGTLQKEGFYQVQEVDFYPYQVKADLKDIKERAYNFILLDMGVYSFYSDRQKELFSQADDFLFVCSSRSWEFPNMKEVLQVPDSTYLLNLYDPAMKKSLKEMMKKHGEVHFIEYHPDFFAPVFPKSYITKYEKKKEKRSRWFR